MGSTQLYGEHFFDGIEQPSVNSARIIVPLVMEFLQPESVIDVGCGRGIWLKVFSEHGVRKLTGVDGPHIDPERLVIPQDAFLGVDLSQDFSLKGLYSLAVCLEVVEHLPHAMGHRLVQQLTKLAPAVLFSAAIPGQEGTGHINERWPWYWQDVFAKQGFHLLDPFRRTVMYDRRVAPWYRQNMVLYASASAIAMSEKLQQEVHAEPKALEWVHVSCIDSRLHEWVARNARLGRVLRAVARRALRASEEPVVR